MRLRTSSTLATAVMALAALAPLSQGAAQSTAGSGETLFKQRCAACHSVTKGAANGVGPNLAGVVGRKAGAGSFAYSAPLKNSKMVWTKANLERYLAAPTRVVPGTRMVVALPDAKQRAAVVEYLSK